MFSICWFTFITKAQLPILYPMAEYFPGAPCNEPLIASTPIQYVVIVPPECPDLSTVLCGVLCFSFEIMCFSNLWQPAVDDC